MKNVKFLNEKQNVYIQFTGGGSRQMTELYCIALTEERAISICKALNFSKDNDKTFNLPE